MNIEKNVIISYKARLDKSINPKGIHIGENTWVLANSVILAHDHLRKMKVNTYIGKNCLIGIDSIIMPGVVIGDHVVVGAGAIVTKDVKSNCIVAGNPAKVLKTGIKLNNKGQLIKENV
ncbi:acyltransferase [Tenacibaculum sp. M341]|uniref:acyltransferase n=1 Tax=Tenacibaculum sp. M341 TaxID=2530339 RepID=UPI001049A25B|nr:acyltransferase [Tenacibaculum sp. M341]TCI91741.1 acyltransferase [Tenacibaculum sp. M341]